MCEDIFVTGSTEVPLEVLHSEDLRPLDTRIYGIMCSQQQQGQYVVVAKAIAEEVRASLRVTQLAIQRLKKFDFVRVREASERWEPFDRYQRVHVLRLLPSGKVNPKY